MNNDQMKYVETVFKNRARIQGYKPGTKEYMNAQHEFFTGCMAAWTSIGETNLQLSEEEKTEHRGKAMPPRYIFGLMQPYGIFEEDKPVRKPKKQKA